MRLFAAGGLLEEAHKVRAHAAKIALAVGRDDTQQALASLLGQVGLLENTLCRVDIRQVKRGAGVAGIENGSEPYATDKRLDHDAVHLVVGDVAVLTEIDGVNNFVVAVGLIAIEVLCLTAVACGMSAA